MSVRFSAMAGVTAGCVVLAAVSPAAADDAAFYVLDGVAVQLEPMPGRLAVRHEADADSAARALGRAGYAVAGVDRHTLPGWFVASSVARGGDGEASMSASRAVAASGEVAFVSPVFRGPNGFGEVLLTSELYVGFEPGVARSDRAAALREAGAGVAPVVVEERPGLVADAVRVDTLAIDGLEALAVANRLASMDGVRFAEPNFVVTGRALVGPGGGSSPAPDDPWFVDQWSMENTGQPGLVNDPDGFGEVDGFGVPGVDVSALAAWEHTRGDGGQVIVVLDTGVQQDHPDLNVVPGADFTDDDTPGAPLDGGPVNECDRHGTWVAGMAVAFQGNGIGVSGLAPESRVASARIGISTPQCNLNWNGTLQGTIDALNWAESIGARVTNNSNAYNISSTMMRETYEATRDAGVVHFASAGNSGDSGATYPASLGAVRAVGALERRGELAYFSNFGGSLAFTAPGLDVLSTDRTGADGKDPGDYASVMGTSFASPLAAAAAGLVLTIDPGLTSRDVETVLSRSCVDLGAPGFDGTFGWGLIDARAAIGLGACYRSWSLASSSGPTALTNHAMAYDAARGETVLFGGLLGFSSTNETWRWDGASWSSAGVGGPSARYGHAMAYDRQRGVVVLFGGFSGTSRSDETWEWDGSSWTRRAIAGPPARFLHAMAYDESRGVVVLFGGRDSAVLGDTWEYDGSAWTAVTSSPAPSARDYHAMAYDAARGRVVLQGGSVGGGETWLYDADGWQAASGAGSFSRERHAMAFDRERGEVVLFGGLNDDGDERAELWTLGDGGWALRSVTGPSARTRFAASFDELTGETVVHGGLAGSDRPGDTWAWRIEPPVFVQQPAGVEVAPGSEAVLSAEVEGRGSASFEWTRGDGGPLPTDGRYSGVSSPTLVISGVTPADAGTYRVRAWDLCGEAVSVEAAVVVTCAGDANGDGRTDLDDFSVLAVQFGTAGPEADFDGTGIVDLDDFSLLAVAFGCGV